MPNGRAYWFLFGAFTFWLFANQTQIGWLYVIAALLVAVVLAGYWLNRGSLRAITATRTLSIAPDDALHEGDDLTIRLHLASKRRTPAVQLNVTEACPLADPDSDERHLTMFVPVLPLKSGISYPYNVTVYQRGAHTFPPVQVTSRAPFGFFRRSTTLDLPTPTLVYPQLRKLKRLDLLDRQPVAQETYPRAGMGTEVIGVREYRPGDSPRHIHWRSVARRGTLVSKEFAEETQPGVTLVLDRYQPLMPAAATKHTPFELGIKAAVSIAEYALRRRYPLHLAAADDDFALPAGALVWETLMQYSARVQPRADATLPDLLSHRAMQLYIAVVMTWPDKNAIEPIIALKQRGSRVLAVLIDPRSFPAFNQDDPSDSAMQPIANALQAADVETRLLGYGDDWSQVLSDAPQTMDEPLREGQHD